MSATKTLTPAELLRESPQGFWNLKVALSPGGEVSFRIGAEVVTLQPDEAEELADKVRRLAELGRQEDRPDARSLTRVLH
ncbi:hypothetical protein EAS64_31360 [Trebonia kvetii]|uniref:Uncharacterized protein n=1 Tax=Trebonia kvetii TaxID=2480626 RepID=A0A6P2BUN0_9ACTN|nr:hypothetical protein [Trebonia kvetii]TVZ01936.1 hypothetical protein EAS64_31360 [Trebonia kvetii]